MIGTIYTSYTGLLANSQGINTASNNLANIESIGFKRSSAEFSQLVSGMSGSTSGNGNPLQIGLGANTSSISPHFTQGNIRETGISTNMALLGKGFFVTSRNGNTEYTRSGNFRLDQDGFLTAPDGSLVQGYTSRNADGTIDATGELSDVTVNFKESSAPRATTVMRLVTNLSAAAEPGDDYTAVIDVWDAEGNILPLTASFEKTETDGEWTYNIVGNGGEVTVEGGNGVLQFDENGQLASMDGIPVSDPEINQKTLTISGLSGEDLSINWQLLDTTNPNALPYLTNFSSYSNTGTQYQDGFGSGDLQKVEFRDDGTMVGFYTNGDTVDLAQIAVARFNNVNGLKQSSSSFFRATGASGDPTLSSDGSTRILGQSVEMSNVDMAEELTSLIIHQRGFQSSSKAVTTADQVLQEILNLKR